LGVVKLRLRPSSHVKPNSARRLGRLATKTGEECGLRSLVRSWPWFAAAATFTILLLATLGVAPNLWYKILPSIEPYLKQIALIGGGLGAVALLAKAWFAGPRNRGTALVLVGIGVSTIVVLLLTFFADATPAGKLHLVEYGGLAYLTLNGLRVERFNDMAAVVAVLGLLSIGVIDEGIQFLLPNRFFDLMDIAGNWISTGLGLVFWLSCSRFSSFRHDRRD